MLIDKITIKLTAGKGGDGVVRWRQEKFVAKGGPWGGDGGRGGDVYIKGVRNIYKLRQYDANKEYSAKDGGPGGTKLKTGAKGDDLIFEVPVGSKIYNREYDVTYKIDTEDQTIKILSGGKGGYGNDHFKSSVNRSPEEFTTGTKGEHATFDVEVEMIADVGLIGFPNAGKSTLLNELTKAKAKTANYAFTTLEPNLGDFHGYVIADLPGLIEGASEGRGLGHKFLKHVKKTKILVHMISVESDDVVESYNLIRKELLNFNPELKEKDEIVVLSKTDLVNESELETKIKKLENYFKKDIIKISAYDNKDLDRFSEVLSQQLKKAD